MDKQTARNRVFFVSAKEVLQYRSSLGKDDQDEGKRGERRGEGEGGEGRGERERGEGEGGEGRGERERGEGKREEGGVTERGRREEGSKGEEKRIEGPITIASVVLGNVLSFH